MEAILGEAGVVGSWADLEDDLTLGEWGLVALDDDLSVESGAEAVLPTLPGDLGRDVPPSSILRPCSIKSISKIPFKHILSRRFLSKLLMLPQTKAQITQPNGNKQITNS